MGRSAKASASLPSLSSSRCCRCTRAPFHSTKVNRVQLAAMMCLTFIGMLSGAQAAFETAGVDASKAEVLAAIVERADWMMFGLLLLPPLLFLLSMDVWQWCGAQRCERGASDEGDEEQNRVIDAARAEHGTLERWVQTEQQCQRNEPRPRPRRARRRAPWTRRRTRRARRR